MLNINNNFYGNWKRTSAVESRTSDPIKTPPSPPRSRRAQSLKSATAMHAPDNTTGTRHRWVAEPPLPGSAGCSAALPNRWKKGPTMLMMLWGFALNYLWRDSIDTSFFVTTTVKVKLTVKVSAQKIFFAPTTSVWARPWKRWKKFITCSVVQQQRFQFKFVFSERWCEAEKSRKKK